MGCDIHAYIEHFSKKDLASGKCFVDTFSGQLNFGRDYLMFGLIAGVRSMEAPIVPTRGLPTNPPMSWECSNEYYLRVVEDEKEYSSTNRDLLGQRLILKSELERISNTYYYGKKLQPDSQNMIPNPDYHSITWLNVNELLMVRKRYLLNYIEFYDEISGISIKKKKDLINFISNTEERSLMKYTFQPYEPLQLYTSICAMMAMERTSDDIETRFICWFDS